MSRIHVHELLLMGILTALLFIGQVFLAFLPNIEIVSFLIILYTLVFGRKVFLMIYTFILLEGILYGFGLWWFQYLYLWSILAATVLLLRRFNHFLFWSVISGFSDWLSEPSVPFLTSSSAARTPLLPTG